MEYTIEELRQMIQMMDDQLERQGRIVDGRLLSRRDKFKKYAQKLEQASQFSASLNRGV